MCISSKFDYHWNVGIKIVSFPCHQVEIILTTKFIIIENHFTEISAPKAKIKVCNLHHKWFYLRHKVWAYIIFGWLPFIKFWLTQFLSLFPLFYWVRHIFVAEFGTLKTHQKTSGACAEYEHFRLINRPVKFVSLQGDIL